MFIKINNMATGVLPDMFDIAVYNSLKQKSKKEMPLWQKILIGVFVAPVIILFVLINIYLFVKGEKPLA